MLGGLSASPAPEVNPAGKIRRKFLRALSLYRAPHYSPRTPTTPPTLPRSVCPGRMLHFSPAAFLEDSPTAGARPVLAKLGPVPSPRPRPTSWPVKIAGLPLKAYKSV